MDDFEVLYPTTNVRLLDDRIKILSHGDPYGPPGLCIVCRTTLDVDKKFVDFGMVIEFHGSVYFCDSCVGQVVKVLGFISTNSDVFLKFRKAYNDLQAENIELVNEINDLRQYKNALDDFSNLYASVITRPSSDPGSAADEFVEAVVSGESGSKGTQQNSGKSGNVKRRTDVLGDAELDKLLGRTQL